MAKTIRVVSLLLILMMGCRNPDASVPDATSTTVPTATITPRHVASATATTPPSPTPIPTPAFLLDEGILISELFVGTSRAFIELYNPGDEPYDLAGHELIYQQSAEHSELILYQWDTRTWVPPHGHYLLVQENTDVGVLADGYFSALLSAETGGLILQQNTRPIPHTYFAWGVAPPPAYTLGKPAPAPDEVQSLDRLPTGEAGNGRESGDNASDIVLNSTPNPQNSGSVITPSFESAITIAIEVPESVVSGSEFGYLVRIHNQSGRDLHNVQVSVPLADLFNPMVQPAGAEHSDGRLNWIMDTLIADANITQPIYVQAPFLTDELVLNGGFVAAENQPIAFANIVALKIEGGVIPIAAARQQIDQVVTVAGTVTVDSGSFAVAGAGQQFYIEDQSGGIKLFVPAVSGRVSVAVGERIRLIGTIRQQRGTVEIVPSTVAVNVKRLGRAADLIEPQIISAAAVGTDNLILGSLVTLSGQVTRIEAFPYWYEVDLSDTSSETTLLLRIDRSSGISVAGLQLGAAYQISGIYDFVENDYLIKPRIQSDIALLSPPELQIIYQTPSGIASGAATTQTITLINNTPDLLRNIIVTAGIPKLENGVLAGEALNPSGNGKIAGDGNIYWGVSELAGVGGRAVLEFGMVYAGQGVAQAGLAISAETISDTVTISQQIYVNQNIPLAVIQGRTAHSPYADQAVTVNGIVSAILPDLGGMWVQSRNPDNDPNTSEGLFVESAEIDNLRYGDLLQIRGTIIERQGQTTLVADAGGIDRLGRAPNLAVLAPIPLDPPADSAEAAIYYEALEGMRVAIQAPAIVVGATNSDGETAFVLSKWHISEIPWAAKSLGYLLVLDDGRANFPVQLTGDELIFSKGDQLQQVIGVLAFTNNQFKIEPFEPQIYDHGIIRGEKPLPQYDGGNGLLTIATLNTGGLYDRLQPHLGNRPLPTLPTFSTQIERLADTIVRLDAPAVIALQAVESLQVLEKLVSDEALAQFQYTPFLLKGNDPLGYNNAFLVREKMLPVLGVTQMAAANGLTHRPPLILQTTLADQTLFVINVHMVSAESGESTTQNSRLAQADWLLEIVAQLRQDHVDAEIVIMGDLGSLWESAVIKRLESAELSHAFALFANNAALPYTLVQQGQTSAPDAILLSNGLFDKLTTVKALHTSTNFPIIDLSDPTVIRNTVHDPLLITVGE